MAKKQRKSRGLRLALAAAGGSQELARKLISPGRRKKLSRQAVEEWTEVPIHHVLQVERLFNISRYRLRPDIYGPSSPVERDVVHLG